MRALRPPSRAGLARAWLPLILLISQSPAAAGAVAGRDGQLGPQPPRVESPPAIRPLVVIDPGHGGHDPGALNPALGLAEKDVTLAIARQVRRELLKSGRVRVALTRDDDRFLELYRRYAVARRLSASLFISIHADAASDSGAHGATIYTLSDIASDRQAARLALRKDKSDIIKGADLDGETEDVSSIVISVAQRETLNASIQFANLVRRVGAGSVPFRETPHRDAGFAVLKAPDMPSILFETGYITNDVDARFLTSSDGQGLIAKTITEAVRTYFDRSGSDRATER